MAAVGLGVGLADAQDAWSPIVVTAPGGTLAPQPGEPDPHMQIVVDPRHFPGTDATALPAPRPLPQGAFSPLVTGTIPAARKRLAPPAEALSPVRPAAAGAAEAAAAQDQSETPAEAGASLAGEESEAGAPSSDGADGAFFKKAGPLDALPPNATAAQQYCFNTSDTAGDARFAWQAKKIKEMEAELEKRMSLLQAKTEDYKTWLARRDAFSRKAHEKLVSFYSRMRPDAAAVQLATLDENVAAAVMTKLETKVASQIMGEMDPERAAKIATVIAGAAKVPEPKRPPAAPPATAGIDGARDGAGAPLDARAQGEEPRT